MLRSYTRSVISVIALGCAVAGAIAWQEHNAIAAALTDYARGADPFAQLGRVQVAVEVVSVVRASPDSFRLTWIERRYENGQLAATERWAGVFTLVVTPPRTVDALRKNPLGIFIRSIAWSKEFTS